MFKQFGVTLVLLVVAFSSYAQLDRKKMLSAYKEVAKSMLRDSLVVSKKGKGTTAANLGAAAYLSSITEFDSMIIDYEKDLKGYETDDELIEGFEERIKSKFSRFPSRYYTESRKKAKE